MTSFELVFALVTIITSLALTHLLAGFVGVLRNLQRVQFSAPHAHLGMLRIDWRRRDVREIIGQLLRIPGGVIGSAIGRVPRGNTGGSRMSAFQPMPIPPDLGDLLRLDPRSCLD